MIFAPPSRAFALEIKTHIGRVSDSQRKMLDDLSRAGVSVAVCRGIDQALGQLQAWGLLIGRVQ